MPYITHRPKRGRATAGVVALAVTAALAAGCGTTHDPHGAARATTTRTVPATTTATAALTDEQTGEQAYAACLQRGIRASDAVINELFTTGTTIPSSPSEVCSTAGLTPAEVQQVQQQVAG
jgi:hypothetical protein